VSGPLVFGLAALALAACSAQSTANPAPVKLDDLNLTPYLSKPCSLFDADQLSDLGMSKAVAGPAQPNASLCALSTSGAEVIVHLDTGDPFPKADAGKKVAGYPAHELSGNDNSCGVWVVVADQQRLAANATGENACHLAENAATAAIGSIKRQNP
jgi:hypothetical protein